jgi:hypothetical protein
VHFDHLNGKTVSEGKEEAKVESDGSATGERAVDLQLLKRREV